MPTKQFQQHQGFHTPTKVFSAKSVLSVAHQGGVDGIQLLVADTHTAFGRILMYANQQISLFQIIDVILHSLVGANVEQSLQLLDVHLDGTLIQQMCRQTTEHGHIAQVIAGTDVAIDDTLYKVINIRH